jgi:tetratricopeptide (TPR) repeat protein
MVYNFGVMMSGSPDTIDLVKKYTQEIHPDYLVLLIGIDNRWSPSEEERAYPVTELKEEIDNLNYGPRGKGLCIHKRNGFFTRRQKLLTEKVSVLKKLLKENPNNDEICEALATKYIERGQLRLGVQQLEAILELNPDDIWIHERLGTIYMRMGDYSLAEKYFKEGVRLNPWNKHCHNNLGLTYLRLGRIELAVKHLAIGMKINKLSLSRLNQDLVVIAKLAKDLGCGTILLKYPLYNEEIDSVIDKVGKTHLIPVVDSYQSKFREIIKSKNRKDYFFADGFLTAKANFIITQAVYEKIREDFN